MLVDTGATYSVLNCKLTSLSKNAVSVVGVSGQTQNRPFLKPLECQIGDKKLSHTFLYMPDCPILLLGRDMLCTMNAQITFSPEKWLLCLEIPPESALRFHQSLEEEEDKTELILEPIK